MLTLINAFIVAPQKQRELVTLLAAATQQTRRPALALIELQRCSGTPIAPIGARGSRARRSQ